jgi:hypothetical protein
MKNGMYCTESGACREATCPEQALDMWRSAPRTEGHWALVLNNTIIKIEYEEEEKQGE